jgi:hypothetical protein
MVGRQTVPGQPPAMSWDTSSRSARTIGCRSCGAQRITTRGSSAKRRCLASTEEVSAVGGPFTGHRREGGEPAETGILNDQSPRNQFS